MPTIPTFTIDTATGNLERTANPRAPKAVKRRLAGRLMHAVHEPLY